MAAPVPLRSDFDADALRVLAKGSRDPDQTRRLLALSAIYGGGSRSEAAALGGVGLQTVRDWVVAFNADGPDGLIDGKAPGARPRLNAGQRAALRALVEAGPTPAAHGVVRWRLVDLAQILFEDHGVSVSEQTLSRALRSRGYAPLTRAQPGRERLAVHARELAQQPDLRLLRDHPRSLLRRLEQAHRPALAHHLHRTVRLGS